MHTLTDAQSTLINNAKHTHNYEAEALDKYDEGDDSVVEKYTRRFEKETKLSKGHDIGGLIVYFRANTLVAFYDYERFVGAVF